MQHSLPSVVLLLLSPAQAFLCQNALRSVQVVVEALMARAALLHGSAKKKKIKFHLKGPRINSTAALRWDTPQARGLLRIIIT